MTSLDPASTLAAAPPPDRLAASRARSGRISLWYNLLTLAGLVVVALTIVLIVTFMMFSMITPMHNPYVDVVGYLVLPGILAVGLLMCPLGMGLKAWRIHRRFAAEKLTFRLPQIDLNRPRLRRFVLVFSGVTLFVVLPLMGLTSYQGYHYTESSDFCGQVCHAVMEPQATAYEVSSHARVSCAGCHIGSGAGWFVRSKLSGTRQVFKVLNGTYPRPVPPAITELRPARDTCEECHWPAKFFGQQLKTIVHYAPNEANTRREIRVLLKTGGGDPSTGRVEGIHAHMALAGRIEYVAVDEGLQDIPWVKYIADSGEELIYRSDGRAASDPPPPGTPRSVDCMDCHNRAAHKFRPPTEAVDLFLAAGKIDVTLPYIKREAVAALATPYDGPQAAHTGIERALTAFYREHYPQVVGQRGEAVRQAVEAVRSLYRNSFFPHMNVDWRTYPDNIGHLYSPGCLRCHDGRHVNQYGTAISSDCDVCHTFFNELNEPQNAVMEGQFFHSMDLSLHRSLRCDQCHTGGPLPLCIDCHKTGTWLEEKGKDMLRPAP